MAVYKVFFVLLNAWVLCQLCETDAKPVEEVALDVYYESLCPDSRAFCLQQLRPTYSQLKSRIKLTLVPYGNAHVKGRPGEWTFRCQHGPDECYGNIVQTCAIAIMNSTQESLDFVVCAFGFREQSRIIEKCAKSDDLKSKLHHCAEGPMGKNLEEKMARKTESLDPPQTFIPWITVNGKGSEEINNQANDNLMSLVCDQFQSDIPSQCEKPGRLKTDFYRRLAGL